MKKLLYRLHRSTTEGPFRVWREDWGGDQFEILTTQEFNTLSGFCKRFAISLEEAEDD